MVTGLNDLGNGIFEMVGGILSLTNVAKLAKDKSVKGVYWPVTAFFTLWGIWNLYYYPSLGQWCSFSGGVVIVLANLAWVILAIKYLRKPA